MRAIIAQMQIALMLLTRLPAGRLPAAVPNMAQAAWAYPLAGLVVGALGAVILAACAALPAPLAAGVVVAGSLLITGGLHEDGLADVADGFGGGQTTARKLEIMRDSRIGSYGTLALIVSVGMRAAALALMIPQGFAHAAAALIAIECASRAGLPAVLRFVPAARKDGLGQAAAGVNGLHAGIAVIIGAAALTLLGLMAALMVGSAMVLVLLLMVALARHQIGGQTGDVLGAMQQVCALAAWLVISAL